MKLLARFFCGCVLLFGSLQTAGAAEPGAAARGEPLVVDAEKLQFDRAANLAVGQGNVVAQYKGAVLRADQIRYNSLTKDAWAEGNVRLTRGAAEWIAPSIYYNFETHALQTDLARGVIEKIFVRADKVSSTQSNRADIGSVRLSTCDYEQPHYRLEATRGELFGNERVVLYNVTVRLGDLPVFWLPVVLWSLQADSQPFAISLGQSGRWGLYALTTTQWQLNNRWQLGLQLDGRTERGLGGGPELKYRYPNITGQLGGYYTDDADPDDDVDRLTGDDIAHQRYIARWQHKQFLANDWALTLDINRQSDSDVVQDFFPDRYKEESEPTSVIDATWRQQQFSLSALVQPELNEFPAQVERLPEVSLSVQRTRLWQTPLFYEGQTSAGYYRNENGDTADPLFTGHSARASSFHQLVMPQMFFGWLSVVPRAGLRGTWYEDAPEGAADTNEVRRIVYALGVESSAKFWRRWDQARSQWAGIDGLRYVLEPFANYQWVPRPDKQPAELWQFDTYRYASLRDGSSILATRYTALDLAADNAIDACDRQNLVRFGLRQKLQTRRQGRTWDLVEASAWTDWRIQQERDQNEFNDLFGTLRLRPTSWLRLETGVRHDFDAGELRELTTSLHWQHRDRWSFGVGTRFLEQDSNLVSADLALRLSRNWTLQVSQRFDMHDGQWENQEYVLRQELHDWFVSYGLRVRGERVQEDEVLLFFAVTLKAYPGVRLGIN